MIFDFEAYIRHQLSDVCLRHCRRSALVSEMASQQNTIPFVST